jgi:acetyltransferase-like isoleucine patch superfamily enzyme
MTLSQLLQKVRNDPGAAFETARGLLLGEYYRLKFRLLGRRVVIGRFFRVSGPLDIRGPGRVEFGDYCTVASSRLRPTTPYTHSPDALIKFGNRVMLTRTRLGCETLIEVGDNAGLAEAWIMDSDFHSIEASDDGPRYNTRGRSKPVSIGTNAWIGAGAMVLKGVKIGANSVVGAGSVVASSVPPNVVVFGNPARVVWRLRQPVDKKTAAPAAAAPPQDGNPNQVV